MEGTKELEPEQTRGAEEGSEASEPPAWADATFVQRALDAEGAAPAVVVEAVQVREATDVAEHHLSRIFRVTATTRLKDQDGEATSEPCRCLQRHLVLKTLPSDVTLVKRVQRKGFFPNEARMLGEVLPRVQAAVEARVGDRFRPLWARCLLHEEAPHPFILMEDLTAKGYRLVDARRGLGLRHSLVALRELARFHAASRVLLEAPGGVQMLDGTGLKENLDSENPNSFFINKALLVSREISRWEGDFTELGKRMEELAPVIGDRMHHSHYWKPEPEDFSVVAHGDFWTSNLLFRYDAQGRPTRARAVDWQSARLATPAVDLLYVFYCCLSEDVSVNHEDLLLREYHAELNNELQRLGCAHRPSLRQLRAQMDACSAWGFFATVNVLPLVKKPPSRSYNLEDTARDPTKHEALYSEPAYKRCMRRFLPRFVRQGLLDP